MRVQRRCEPGRVQCKQIYTLPVPATQLQAGGSHAEVVGMIALLNAALIALAIIAVADVLPGWVALVPGALMTGALLWYLRTRYGKLGGA